MTRITRRDVAHRMREVLREARDHRRELTLEAKHSDDASCLEASGAIRLTIRDFLPTLDNSLGLPPGMEVDTGVTGAEVWPVSIDDVEMEEEDEVGSLNDQSLGFMQTRGAEPVRTGITVEVSNMAIDSAGFDLLTYIQKKFLLAQRRYVASHLYTNAVLDGNVGPFTEGHYHEWSIPTGDFYQSIIAQMTALEESGFDTRDACIVMDFDMEALLKRTPAVAGEARMVIDNGLCAGYPYVANKYFNTEADANGHLVKKDCDAIGIAIFKWFKIAQHDHARLIIDGVSKDVSDRNVTSVTLNTAWSFTDLSEHINGANRMQAFHTIISQRGYLADEGDHILETADGYLLRVGMGSYPMYLEEHGGAILTADGEPIRTSGPS